MTEPRAYMRTRPEVTQFEDTIITVTFKGKVLKLAEKVELVLPSGEPSQLTCSAVRRDTLGLVAAETVLCW